MNRQILYSSKLFFSCIIILINFAKDINSQVSEEWVHRYTGPESSADTPNDFYTDESGNVYITGKTILSGGYSDIITAKFNSNGVRQWIATYKGAGNDNDEGTAVAVSSNGNIYICGNTRTASGQYNIIVIKYNSSGIQQWIRAYNGTGNFDDIAMNILIDPNQNIYVGGYSLGAGSGYDFVLLKYNTAGNSQWVQRWNGLSNSDDYLKNMSFTANGDIVVTGSSYDNNTLNDFVTIKYNSGGSLLWVKKYNGAQSGDDQVTNLKTDLQDNTYICGKTTGTGAGYDYAVIKYNSSGVEQWVRSYNGSLSNDDVPASVDADINGNVYVTGYSWTGSSFYDFATIKYNSSGVEQWTRFYNSDDNFIDKAVDIKVDVQGNAYVTGQTVITDGTNDIVSLKYNSSGNLQWHKSYDGPGSLDDIPVMMNIDQKESLFIIGSSYSYFFSLCGTTDYVILKYNLNGDFVWDSRYDGAGDGPDEATSMALDNNGVLYTIGSSFDKVSNIDYATIQYNSAGVPLWAVRYDGGNGIDKPVSVFVYENENIYLTGSSIGLGIGYEIATVKYNSGSSLIWEQRYNGIGNGDDFASAMTVDASGNAYITGYSDGIGTGKDYITLKYNPGGILQWAARYNGPGNSNDFASSIVLDSSGNVYVTGKSIGAGTMEDIATVKYNSSGVQQWVSRFNGAGNNSDEANGIVLAPGGNIVVTGKSKSLNLKYDIVTINYNTSGSQQWIKTFNGSSDEDDEAGSVTSDQSGNIYVSGSSKNTGTGFDFTTIKYSPSGTDLWVKNFNGGLNEDDMASASCIDNAGNIYVTGFCKDPGTNLDFCTIKYSGSGDLKWIQKYNHIDNDSDRASCIKVDNEGNVFVAGSSKGLEGGKDFLTVKYKQNKVLELSSLIEARYNENTNRMITDSLKVYLRSFIFPYGKVDSAVAVTDSLGKAEFYFFNAQSGNKYYIVIDHKNSIETWSSSGHTFNSNSMSYDFSTGASQSYGNNLKQKGSRFCVYSGDVNKDGTVDVGDISIVDNAIFNFASGYNISDLNGDKVVDALDMSYVDNNSFNFVSVIRP